MSPIDVRTGPAVAGAHGGAARHAPGLLRRLRSPALLRRLALVSVVANVAIVVTGGAVRLTNSGLGCPTWPHCSGGALVPSQQLGLHGVIEFANRLLTFVVAIVLLATLVTAVVQRRQARLALVAFLGIPAQAVLGGIVVLSDLNPWLVAAHFLLSIVIVAVVFVLWWRLAGARPVAVAAPVARLARGLTVVSAVVLAIGTVVTGTGPHAGDLDHRNRLHRIGLSPEGVSQLHADVVMLLVGATVATLVLVAALRLPRSVRRAAVVLLAVELSQAVVGYAQYFLHVPAGLVALHMLGACLIWLAVLRLDLSLTANRSPSAQGAGG